MTDAIILPKPSQTNYPLIWLNNVKESAKSLLDMSKWLILELFKVRHSAKHLRWRWFLLIRGHWLSIQMNGDK